ncbi:SPFH domain-containing protein [Fodinibius sediminis]|uniref:SPFH domain, Band 7 family protein n=1 Tax=Fodinibius sediminis TaxID=1214077 RepID=A0A521BW27_9BACT|nr:stomatin-like protein [Fodinibius sediminis]SMO51368.1 SPFH domain, Band 7 family protein [Fodinibius sediminis]
MIELISQAVLGLLSVYILFKFIQSIQLVPTQRAYVVERLGNYHKTLGPGFHALVPFFDKVKYKQDLREETIEVEPQECFTRDNVKVEVDGVIYLAVIDPVNASYGVTNYRFAAVQLAQTTTRSIIGKMDLDDTFEDRAIINKEVVQVLSEMEQAWGIRVLRYEIKNIYTPKTIQNAMERQMTAERERRATIARSEGIMQSTINDAEGEKKEIINKSEGEMQRQINEAEGVAQEIESIAEATATSIEEIAGALSHDKGKEAMQMRLAEQYIQQLSKLASDKNDVIIPKDVTNYDAIMSGLSLDKISIVPEERNQ